MLNNVEQGKEVWKPTPFKVKFSPQHAVIDTLSQHTDTDTDTDTGTDTDTDTY
jgi:hypothetical protein